MAVQEVILNTKPAGPVDYSEKAVKKVFDTTGYFIADTKEDGVQLNLVVKPNEDDPIRWLSRAGKEFPALVLGSDGVAIQQCENILQDDQCIYPQGFMLQAEIITIGKPAEITAGTLRRTKGSGPFFNWDGIEVHVFGVAPLDVIESGQDHDVTHAVMKYHVEAITALLQKHVPQITWKVVESVDVFTPEDLQMVYGVRREQGKEGLVLKDPNAIWKRGKKVGQWKMKPEDTIDGKVVGLVWGTPGLANEGKVIGFEVELEDGMVVNACGLTQAQKDEFTEAVVGVPLSCQGQHEEFHQHRINGQVDNPFDGWAVEVLFMERFKDGSLRHPSFSRWRGISDPLVKE